MLGKRGRGTGGEHLYVTHPLVFSSRSRGQGVKGSRGSLHVIRLFLKKIICQISLQSYEEVGKKNSGWEGLGGGVYKAHPPLPETLPSIRNIEYDNQTKEK